MAKKSGPAAGGGQKDAKSPPPAKAGGAEHTGAGKSTHGPAPKKKSEPPPKTPPKKTTPSPKQGVLPAPQVDDSILARFATDGMLDGLNHFAALVHVGEAGDMTSDNSSSSDHQLSPRSAAPMVRAAWISPMCV